MRSKIATGWKKGCRVAVLILISSIAPAAVPQTNSSVAHTPEQVRPTNQGESFALKDGTAIKLETVGSVSSLNARRGNKVTFEVMEDVLLQGIPVIPKGTLVSGMITGVKPKRRLARGDQLRISLESLRAIDGEKVQLRGEKAATGRNHVTAMTGAIAASGVLFFPATPFFLLLHGKDATIPESTELTGYVDGDTPLILENFTRRTTDASNALTSLLSISSSPPEADIEVDGNIAGRAPAAVRLVPGEHRIIVRKTGFSKWDKKISISPGETVISVDLIPD